MDPTARFTAVRCLFCVVLWCFVSSATVQRLLRCILEFLSIVNVFDLFRLSRSFCCLLYLPSFSHPLSGGVSRLIIWTERRVRTARRVNKKNGSRTLPLIDPRDCCLEKLYSFVDWLYTHSPLTSSAVCSSVLCCILFVRLTVFVCCLLAVLLCCICGGRTYSRCCPLSSPSSSYALVLLCSSAEHRTDGAN